MSRVISVAGNVPSGRFSYCPRTLIHIATKKSHDGVQCCVLFLDAHLVDHDALIAVSTRPRGVVRDSGGFHKRVLTSVDWPPLGGGVTK